MNAVDIMTINPTTLQADDSVSAAVEILQELSVRHLPVVNDSGELVGMLSDRDLRALLVPTIHPSGEVEQFLARARAPVSTVMSGNVVSVETEDDVAVVAERLLENGVGALPVVDGDGTLVGMISYVDLLRHYVAQA